MSALRVAIAALVLSFAVPAAHAQCVSLATLGSASGQNFNSLATSGTTNDLATLPAMAGWSLNETGGGARDNERYGADTGGSPTSNTGDAYSYGAAANTDRALGGLQSGTLVPVFGACFTNNTGATITSLDVDYFGEQWRIGNTAAARDDRLDFQYSLDATSLTTGAWTDHNALDFTNPIKTNTSAAGLDGNAAANRSNRVSSIGSLSIANGATFWIRWNDLNASGADDGLAVDDFFLTPQGAAPTPTLNIDNVSQVETNAATTTFAFTVTLTSPAPSGGVTFNIATADGTATTADSDYVASSLTGQTIPAGQTNYTFNVTVNGDTNIESAETFSVDVTSIVGANAGDTQGTGTIQNDDSTTLNVGNVTQTEGPSGTSTFTFTVSLSQPAGPDGVAFDIATADDTATTADGDYVANSVTGMTIGAGDSSAEFVVTVNGDGNIEPTETFFVNVTNITGATPGDVQGLGTITTDEPLLSVGNVTQAETNSATTTFAFAVTLDIPAPAGGVTFDIATAPGTAIAGTDYVHQELTGQSIAAGGTTYTFNVTVNGDAQFEGNDTFFVNVTNVSAGTGVSDPQGLGTITNDDTAPAFSIADVALTEGNAGTQTMTFTVTLAGAREGSVDVNITTADSSATTADNDYVANSTTLTFAPADTTKTFDVTINGDTAIEGNEQFFVTLSGATAGATISDAQALGIIRLDDAFSIAAVDTSYVEDFDELAQTTAATTPAAWTQSESGTSSDFTYAAGTGSSTGGNTYSFGIAGVNAVTDRAFGTLLSGSVTPTIGALYVNDTGTTITSLSIEYFGEQWRLGTASRADRLDFQYSLDATSLTTGTWIDADALDFSTPTQSTIGLKDGNAAANRTKLVHTISGLSIEPSETVWIRFNDFNATGADDGLAVDDFSIIANFAGSFITIDDVQQFEGDAGTVTYTFTVTLTQPAPEGGVTFDIATADGTATAGSDYVAKSLAAQTIDEGNSTFTFDVTVNNDVASESVAEHFFVNITNISGALPEDTQGTGTIVDNDVTIVPIHDVQGPGAVSPIPGSSVTIRGIVTGVKSNGFFVQEEDADAALENDPATSEGVFVFTSVSPAASIVLGAEVMVSGTVVEFVPAGDPQQPPFTELASPSYVRVSTGNPLPTPVTLTNTFPNPAGPHDQLERVESMRVQVPSLTVVAPTQGSFTEITGSVSHTGRFYGVVTGTPRPFREPGIQAPDAPPSGSIPPIPRWDFNPERLKVDSNALGAGLLVVQTNDVVTNLVGPLEYGFRAYAILPDGTAPQAVTPGVLPATATAPLATEVTIASFNLNRLFNDIDGESNGPDVDTAVYQNRLGKASLAIRNNLQMPDVIGVQEVENLGTLQDLAARISADANAAGQPDPQYDAYLVEGNDVGGIDVGYLVKTSEVSAGVPRVTVNSVTQELDGTQWTDPDDGNLATLNDRPPLVLDATINQPTGATYDITVINNHLRSLLGIESEEPDGLTTEGDRVRRKRLAQAQDLAKLIDSYQDADPTRNIILVGDFNAFEFNDGYVDVINTITGTPPPDNETVVPGDGLDLVDSDLDNLVDTPPPSERYSYLHDGNAQNIDHAIVNQALITSTSARRIEHPRIDADYPDTERNDPSNAIRVSDHDPVLAYFSPIVFTPSQISVADTSQAEGNAGTATMTFTVALDTPSATPVTVDWATSNGTATAGVDYTSDSGTVTFVPGDVSETFTVDVTGDTAFEADETLTVTLTNNTGNSTIADATATGTITNDDAITVSIADTSVSEGDSGTASLTFTVTLSNAPGQPVTVNYATSNGTATAGTDYTVASGTIMFVAGDISETVTIDVSGDPTFESNETVIVTLSSPEGLAISDGEATGTITNDDATAMISIDDPSVVETDAGTTTLTYTVTLDKAAGETVTVNFTTSNGTASSASDYTANSGTVTFTAGDLSETISVTVNGDTLPEDDETVIVTLSNPSANAALAETTGTGTITNDDLTLISIGNTSVVEGNAGTSSLTYTVTLSSPISTTVTVNYITDGGTATAGDDYTGTSGTVTFIAGDTSETITVSVNGDVTFEPDETVTVTLSSPSANASISDGEATGTITNDDGVSLISIEDASVTEGNAGTATLTFNVTLSPAAEGTVTVNYATSNGTATTADSDYVAESGTVTFVAGDTTETITIDVTGDVMFEPNETLLVTLSTPSANASIADAEATGTINNDDAVSMISIEDASVTEGDAGTATLTFNVTLDKAADETVTVNYATSNGTATTADSDYTAESGTVTFVAGDTTETITIDVTGDVTFEANETLLITLSTPSANANIADAEATGAINNDDATALLSIADRSVTEGDAGTTTMTFTVTLDKAADETVTVNYATSDGTAEAAIDYAATSGTLTFVPGDLSESFEVTVNGDTIAEDDETLTVTLSSPSAAASIGTPTATGTITNDDAALISIDDPSAIEGDAGTTTMTFTVTLSTPASANVTVDYSTSNGTATAGDDYVATSGTVTFVPGDTTETFTIDVNGDATVESDETLIVTLSKPSPNASLADAEATGTITNDDGVALISIADANVLEGDAGTATLTFTVTLDAAADAPVTVNYATSNATATAGSDYTAKSGTVTFVAGDISETVTVDVTGDVTFEAHETLLITLSTPSANANLADDEGTGTITNDDDTSMISIADADVLEGDAGTATLTFTVTLDVAADGPVTVNYATSNGTATAGSDYTAESGTVTFVAGDLSETITIDVAGDVTFEANETLLVTFSTPSANASIADAQATGTITNDDATSMISIADTFTSEGNAGTNTLTFTVTLDKPADDEVTVDYVTSDDTATAGSDYVAASGTVTFTPGDVSELLTITVNGDTVTEGDETLFVTLSNPSPNAAIAEDSAIGTIINDDEVAAAALIVEMTVAPEVKRAEEPITKTTVVTNDGTDPATNVVLTDDLQTGLTLLSAGTTQGTCNNADPVVCQLGTIAAGASVTVTLIVEAANGGTYTNSVSVVSDQQVAASADSETFGVGGAAGTAQIPTLSEYMLFALMAVLAALAMLKLR
jgi:predicted extracellular nuclease